MSVRPVDFNGMMQNQQNVSNIKQHEDAKPMMQQHQALNTVNKQQEAAARQVSGKDHLEKEEERFDARDKGRNKYKGSHQKRREQHREQMDDGQVRVKGLTGGFDITV